MFYWNLKLLNSVWPKSPAKCRKPCYSILAWKIHYTSASLSFSAFLIFLMFKYFFRLVFECLLYHYFFWPHADWKIQGFEIVRSGQDSFRCCDVNLKISADQWWFCPDWGKNWKLLITDPLKPVPQLLVVTEQNAWLTVNRVFFFFFFDLQNRDIVPSVTEDNLQRKLYKQVVKQFHFLKWHLRWKWCSCLYHGHTNLPELTICSEIFPLQRILKKSNSSSFGTTENVLDRFLVRNILQYIF